VPELGGTRYKGQSGRVGVVGGSLEYTGAPFYAAISALKLGADLSHVFCDEAAGTAIKGYSPELIVHPVIRSSGVLEREGKVLKTEQGSSGVLEREGRACDADAIAVMAQASADAIIRWLGALDALVIGPGLGRNPALLAAVAHVVRAAAETGLPTVIDADGLRVVMDQPELVRGEQAVFVLTPNRAELLRLYDRLVPAAERTAEPDDDSSDALVRRAAQVCAKLGPSVVLVAKGAVDVIHDGNSALLVSDPGAPKRSGGQGDVLAGVLASLLAWSHSTDDAARAATAGVGVSPAVLAAWGAATLTRRISREAYRAHKRSMTAPDLVAAIAPVMEKWHPAPPLASE